MFREGVQLRNGVLTVQYSIFGENLVAVILLPNTNNPPKDPSIVCRYTIECWDGNTNLVSYFVCGNRPLLTILSLGSLISMLLVNTNLLTKLSSGITIYLLDPKTIQTRRQQIGVDRKTLFRPI